MYKRDGMWGGGTRARSLELEDALTTASSFRGSPAAIGWCLRCPFRDADQIAVPVFCWHCSATGTSYRAGAERTGSLAVRHEISPGQEARRASGQVSQSLFDFFRSEWSVCVGSGEGINAFYHSKTYPNLIPIIFPPITYDSCSC